MIVSHLRFALAVLAERIPTAKSSLPDPRVMVLELADLPSGWQRKGARTFRTGLITPTAPWAQRLRDAHGISIVVSFRASDDPWAMVVSQAIPFATAADATAALPTMEERLLGNPDPRVVETHRVALDLSTPLGDQCAALMLESTNLGEPGSQGAQLLALWRHGSILALLTVSGRAGRFSVEDLVALVQNQGTKFDLTGAPPDRSRRRLPCDRSRRLRLLQTMSSETALALRQDKRINDALEARQAL